MKLYIFEIATTDNPPLTILFATYNIYIESEFKKVKGAAPLVLRLSNIN